MEKKTMGSFLVALRKANGLTQKDVADRLAVSDKAVSRWERDETLPDITFLPALAEMFGVTCDELLKGEKATEPVSGNEPQDNKKVEKQRKALIGNCRLELKKKTILFMLISHGGPLLNLPFAFADNRLFYLGLAIWGIVLLVSVYIGISAILKANSVLNSDEFTDFQDETLIADFIETKNQAASHLKKMLIFMLIIYIPSWGIAVIPTIIGFILEILSIAAVFAFRNIDLKKIF